MTDWGDNVAFFADIDADFETTVLNDDQPIVWQGTNIQIKKYFELPVPILQPGSVLSYQFETTPGDISFQLFMCSEEGEEEDEILIQNERLDSHIAPVVGELKMTRCGYCVFQFDNTYSWLTDKELSYRIQLFNIPLEAVERDRMYKSRLILQSIAMDNSKLFRGCTRAEAKYIESEQQILSVEREIEALQTKLMHLREAHVHFRQDYNEQRLLWEQNDSKVLGLCIRCLDRRLLSVVFSFLIGEGRGGRNKHIINSISPSGNSSNIKNSHQQQQQQQHDRETVLHLMLVCRYWLKIILSDVLRVSVAESGASRLPLLQQPLLAPADEVVVPTDAD